MLYFVIKYNIQVDVFLHYFDYLLFLKFPLFIINKILIQVYIYFLFTLIKVIKVSVAFEIKRKNILIYNIFTLQLFYSQHKYLLNHNNVSMIFIEVFITSRNSSLLFSRRTGIQLTIISKLICRTRSRSSSLFKSLFTFVMNV